MRFNYIIDKLGKYVNNKPEIHLKTLKDVVNIFYNSLSKQEREVFKIRCSNNNFDLFKLLDLQSTQKTLDKWFKKIEKLMSIKI